jgi:hypothetical protein
MYARTNLVVGDPARIDDVTHYLETTVRPHVDEQPGSRGLAILINRDLGLTLVASYWETADALAASEQAVQASRKEATKMAGGLVTVDHYEVPVFVRRARPGPGAGCRVTTVETSPAEVDAAAQAFRERAVPRLEQIEGLCSVQMLMDRYSGRCMVIAAFEDKAAMIASTADIAQVRADTLAKSGATLRSMQDFTLVSGAVRERGTNSLTEREVELWNAGDRESWTALMDEHNFELHAPGGLEIRGREAIDLLWDTWHQAFPDNRLVPVGIYGDEHGGVLEGRFTGTHTGTLHGPGGDIPATGRTVNARFSEVHRVRGGKELDTHIYFDQMDLLTQLGVTSAG